MFYKVPASSTPVPNFSTTFCLVKSTICLASSKLLIILSISAILIIYLSNTNAVLMKKSLQGNTKKFLETVALNIKKARLKQEMKGEVLGKTIGVSKSYISQLESGDVDIKLSTIFKIAEALGFEVRDLLVCPFSTNIQHSLETETQQKILSFNQLTVEKMLQKIEKLNSEIKELKTS
ncbi:MAG: helix-turn-helix domain-containing protein [Chitinophagaceae bacterium]